MAKINTLNYQTVASWNGSQDLFVVEQPDGTKVATPEQIKQYVLNDMDEVPTQDSNKPVKSGGIFNSEDDIWKANGMLGAKNLYNSQYSVPRTNAGTTATLGDDGHVIMNGTANADAAQFNRPGTSIKPIKDLKVGDKLILSYKVISGTFTHGSSSRNTALYFNNKNNSAVDPIIFPLSLSAGDSDSKEIALTNECFTDGILDLKDIQIYMRSGDTFNNLELAIMLRLASDTDNTYQPYAKTNKQLTETIGDLTATGVTGASAAAQIGALNTTIGDLSQTGLTGDSVAEQLSTAREQIAGLTANTLTGIDISAYNSAANQYTAPTDGYVRMELRNANHYFYLNVNDAVMLGGEGHQVTNVYDYMSIFIKKGMKLYYSGTVQTAIFYSLV